MMAKLQDFSVTVHKSLQQPDLLLGVPKMIIALILMVTVIFAYLLGVAFALIGVVLYIPCRLISKNDPQLLVIALESLMLVDHLEG